MLARLRVWSRRDRGRGLDLRVGRGRSVGRARSVGLRGRYRHGLPVEPLGFGRVRRLSGGRGWGSDFGFLLTRSEERSGGEDAE